MTNMNDKMNISLPAETNNDDQRENSYSEVVNISLNNSVTKKFLCDTCDFKGNDKAAVTRHIRSKHRTVGQKQKRNDS